MLTDDSWKLLSKIMHLTGRIYNKPEHRMTLEGILFRIRTGIPWRDLPRQFGEWNTVGYTTHWRYRVTENNRSTTGNTDRVIGHHDKTTPAPPRATFYALTEGVGSWLRKHNASIARPSAYPASIDALQEGRYTLRPRWFVPSKAHPTNGSVIAYQ